MRVTFTIPGPPQGKARARTFYNPALGRMQSITPDKTILYENLIKACYQKEAGGVFFPKGTPVLVLIRADFDIPKSATKKARSEMMVGTILPTKKPDADNVIKTVLDALNGVAYHDDTQVTNIMFIKQYITDEKNAPGLLVTVAEAPHNAEF